MCVLESCGLFVGVVSVWGVLAFSAYYRYFSVIQTMQIQPRPNVTTLDMTLYAPYIWRKNYIQNHMYIKTLFHFVRTICVRYTRLYRTLMRKRTRHLTLRTPQVTQHFLYVHVLRFTAYKNVRSKSVYVGQMS